MADLTKITDYIAEKAFKEAEDIKKEADEKYEALMKQAEVDAQNEYNKIISSAQQQAAEIELRAQSKAKQLASQDILKLKIQSIESVIQKAKEKIYAMDDSAYAVFIEKLFKRYAEEYSGKGGIFSRIIGRLNPENRGEIMFNEKDLERLTLDAKELFSKYNLVINNTPCDIDGGFILKYGNIEENCSISAIFREKQELLTDYISTRLFSDI